MLENVKARGVQLHNGLKALQSKYPGRITDVSVPTRVATSPPKLLT